MGGELPWVEIARIPLLWVTLPAILVILMYGGRGLVWAIFAALIGILAFLFWLFLLGGIKQPTGIEGLALVIWPVLWLLGSVWAWIVYLVVAVVGLLPHQRQHRASNVK